jgi:hypothetical protein
MRVACLARLPHKDEQEGALVPTPLQDTIALQHIHHKSREPGNRLTAYFIPVPSFSR